MTECLLLLHSWHLYDPGTCIHLGRPRILETYIFPPTFHKSCHHCPTLPNSITHGYIAVPACKNFLRATLFPHGGLSIFQRLETDGCQQQQYVWVSWSLLNSVLLDICTYFVPKANDLFGWIDRMLFLPFLLQIPLSLPHQKRCVWQGVSCHLLHHVSPVYIIC